METHRRQHYDLKQHVSVGELARVSLGGTRQQTLTVVSTGANGIIGKDDNGKTYRILWRNVLGPDGKPGSLVKSVIDRLCSCPAKHPPLPTGADELLAKIPPEILAKSRRR